MFYLLSVSFLLIMPWHSAKIVSLNDVTRAFTQHSMSWNTSKISQGYYIGCIAQIYSNSQNKTILSNRKKIIILKVDFTYLYYRIIEDGYATLVYQSIFSPEEKNYRTRLSLDILTKVLKERREKYTK